MLFSHEKVVITQFNAGHWFYPPIYLKSLTLIYVLISVTKFSLTLLCFRFDPLTFELSVCTVIMVKVKYL